MINDDKPLLKITDTGVLVYGTPWNGKHQLSCNTAVPLKAIALLERDNVNHIEPIDSREALPMTVQQTYRPRNPAALMKVMELVDLLGACTPFYKLGCNMDMDAAAVAYAGMNPNKIIIPEAHEPPV